MIVLAAWRLARAGEHQLGWALLTARPLHGHQLRSACFTPGRGQAFASGAALLVDLDDTLIPDRAARDEALPTVLGTSVDRTKVWLAVRAAWRASGLRSVPALAGVSLPVLLVPAECPVVGGAAG